MEELFTIPATGFLVVSSLSLCFKSANRNKDVLQEGKQDDSSLAQAGVECLNFGDLGLSLPQPLGKIL